MKKMLLLAYLIGIKICLFGQMEIEPFIPNAMPGWAYVNYVSLKEDKSHKNALQIDTIYRLKFVAAKFDTTAWDSVLVLKNTVCYHLKNRKIGDTTHLIFSENNRIYDIKPPVFRKNTIFTQDYKHYTAWESTKKYSDCLATDAKYYETISLIEHLIKIKSKEIQLIKPAIIHIKEGEKDTTYELIPPSPYLEMDKIEAKYRYIPILNKKISARIDTIMEIGNHHSDSKIQENKQYFTTDKTVNDWQRINCAVCFSHANIIPQIQLALQKRNYYKGEINNVFTPETRAALIAFQKDNYLEQGKISMETLDELDIDTD